MSRPDGYLLPKVKLDPENIVREVARGFRVTYDEIMGRRRERSIVIARACAMAVVRRATTMSYPEIGDLFDRDHTTVMHHVQKVMSDPELAQGIELVVQELSPPPQLFAVPGEREQAL